MFVLAGDTINDYMVLDNKSKSFYDSNSLLSEIKRHHWITKI